LAKVDQKLIEALNHALSEEIAAIIQYLWHHVMVRGMESPELMDKFRSTAMDEMRHAEKLAERIDYLGGVPTTRMGEVRIGGEAKKMVEDDLEAENRAIQMYKNYIELAANLGDPVTRHMLEDILEEEEGHAHLWETVLGR